MTIKPRMGQAYPVPGRMLAARNADLPAARRMEFRMGTHLEEVQVEGERLFGTGVNVATRLEGLAEPGGACAPPERARSGGPRTA